MPEQYRLAKLYRFLDALEPDARGCLIWPGNKTAKGYIGVALAVGVVILITAIMIIWRVTAPPPLPPVKFTDRILPDTTSIIPKPIRIIPLEREQPPASTFPATHEAAVTQAPAPSPPLPAVTLSTPEGDTCTRVHRRKRYYNNGKSWRCVK